MQGLIDCERESVGLEACIYPPNTASLVKTQQMRGQPQWSLCGRRDPVLARAFSQPTFGSDRKMPEKRLGRGGKRSECSLNHGCWEVRPSARQNSWLPG